MVCAGPAVPVSQKPFNIPPGMLFAVSLGQGFSAAEVCQGFVGSCITTALRWGLLTHSTAAASQSCVRLFSQHYPLCQHSLLPLFQGKEANCLTAGMLQAAGKILRKNTLCEPGKY